MKWLIIGAALLLLAACEEKEGGIPPEFNLVYSEGAYHFAYITGEAIGSTVKQREGGEAICEKFNRGQDCQVFMWKNRDDISDGFPISGRSAQTMGYFQLSDGKIKQKTLK